MRYGLNQDETFCLSLTIDERIKVLEELDHIDRLAFGYSEDRLDQKRCTCRLISAMLSSEVNLKSWRLKMKGNMKKLMMGVVAAMAMGAMADSANTVKVTKFHQSYPYSGKATVNYTVGGTLPANAVAEIILNTDDASATFVQSNIVTGANSHVIDFASSFGGVRVLTDASFVMAINLNPGGNNLGGVQLWTGGPYWAACTVGATEPEEFGYYFWWGDTVGYTRSGGIWEESTHRFYDVTWVSSTGEQMDSSPFVTNSCPTVFKDNSTLQSEGWIDATTNLVAAHDAATAYLGAPWRMPTYPEIQALVDNCATTWITTNGVKGRLVTGTGAYANRSIFLPAPGYGSGSNFGNPNLRGYYWSSTPDSDNSYKAWYLDFNSSLFQRDTYYGRQYGLSVRPVRDAD